MEMLKTVPMKHTITAGICLFLLLGLVLLAATTADAGYKSTELVYAWDEVAPGYQASNVIITFNGGWVPFFHEMNTFDADVYPTDYLPLPAGAPTDACPGVPGSTTTYAGIMQFGLYHTDNSPAGAPGFVRSYEWQIVRCDRDGDGDMDNQDLSLAPGTANMVPAPGVILDVYDVDRVVPCGGGNCQDEIVTSMYVNFDADCNGTLDPQPAGGLCFYALAQTPTSVTWGGPLQARISAGGGDKTVNFSPREGPLAVTLSSFGTSSAVRYAAGLSVLGVAALGLLVWRAKRSR